MEPPDGSLTVHAPHILTADRAKRQIDAGLDSSGTVRLMDTRVLDRLSDLSVRSTLFGDTFNQRGGMIG